MILLLLLSPFILFFLHICVSRLQIAVNKKISSSMSLALAIALGFMVIAIFVAPGLEGFYGLLYCTIVYGCFSYAYVHLFYMGETARRLHILYELKLHGAMTQEQLTQRYSAQMMLEVRLHRLVAMGQLKREGNRYVLQKRLLCWASGILMVWASLIGFRSEVLDKSASKATPPNPPH